MMSWGAHLVVVASGFIVPRLIDNGLGKELLGVWDLCWSLVSYCLLLQSGIGASVNRHIALHLKEADQDAANRVASSVAMIQRALSVVVVALVAGAIMALPLILGSADAALLSEARWVVGILGVATAVNFAGAVYTGILTGCHRWVLHHGFYVATSLLSLLGMVGALCAGFGLPALALVYFVTEVIGRIARAVACYRVCPGLKVSFSCATLSTAREMLSFGGKLFVGRLSTIIMNQTVNVMIFVAMGPAILALYARPRSLVRHAAVFSQKYAMMLVPGAALLGDASDRKKLRKLFVRSTRSGLFMTLPIVAMLLVVGGPLLELWMGLDYADSGLLALLALGFLAESAYQPLNSILFGRGLHGIPALMILGGGLCALLGVGVCLLFGAENLSWIAIAVGVPWTLVHGVMIPLYGCKKLGIRFFGFLRTAWLGPILCSLAVGCGFYAGRAVFPITAVSQLLGAGLIGGTTLVACYYVWVIPSEWKAAFHGWLKRRSGQSELA